MSYFGATVVFDPTASKLVKKMTEVASGNQIKLDWFLEGYLSEPIKLRCWVDKNNYVYTESVVKMIDESGRLTIFTDIVLVRDPVKFFMG